MARGASIEERIARNHRVLQAIVDRAGRLAASGDAEAAAVTAQVAAEFASRNHPGTFASPRLEQVLHRVARATAGDPPKAAAAPREPGPARVLHVLSQAHAKGGHTRLAWRWIGNDDRRVHSVALLGQGGIPVPPALAEAVARRGGTIHRIDRACARLVDRARALREVARGAEFVVLHVHPFDVVPVLAFAGAAKRPRILFMNHADHLFWVGAGIADHVACFRETGVTLCTQRRAIPATRCSIVPIPVDVPVRTRSREEAKAALGLAADCALCLTAAFSYKFATARAEAHLTEVVRPVLEAEKRAVVLAIGPAREGPWKAAHRATGGRVDALGERADMRTYYEAADLFLMPMPVASLTAALEAGSHGMPILELRDGASSASVFDSESPGLAAASVIRADDVAGYRAQLTRLLRDPEARAQAGGAARDAILDGHAQAAWLACVDAAFAQAAANPPREAHAVPEPAPQCTPTDARLCGLRPGLLAELGFILARQGRSLSLAGRLRLFLSGFGVEGARPTRYFPLELALVFLSGPQVESLRTASESTGWFRRYLDK